MPPTLLPSLLLWPIPLSKTKAAGRPSYVNTAWSISSENYLLPEKHLDYIQLSKSAAASGFHILEEIQKGKLYFEKKNAHALLSFKGKLTFPSAFILLLPACWYKKLSLFFGENSSSHVASEAVEASLLPTLGSAAVLCRKCSTISILSFSFLKGEKRRRISSIIQILFSHYCANFSPDRYFESRLQLKKILSLWLPPAWFVGGQSRFFSDTRDLYISRLEYFMYSVRGL